MRRLLAAVVAGVVFFALFVSLINRGAMLVWPAYGEAFPTNSFSSGMMILRLCMGAAALLGSGYLVAAISRVKHLAAIIAAGVLLLLGGTVHLNEPIWSSFPLWYHIAFIGSIVPAVLIGARLRRA
ncbi:hypothetical protein [Porphyrobacter sp. AAP82]|uniref:hypothetical protein n=1 Tax=Porphyrobacter sp. AAP82 TaxID=1248917 RepID=UPI00036FEBF7|nr:hypothetical protein [Porphyrobacter sp. AAP82]